MNYQHKEAFCVMTYACVGDPHPVARQTERVLSGCGHRERFWNSRDGVTPFMMPCPSCGGHLQHVDWHNDLCAPTHTPHWGQGIWRDGTPDEAEAIIRKRLAQFPAAERAREMIAEARAGKLSEFQPGWPMFARHTPL